ncbi:hypothetical protein [Lentzea aerocolonigenes]|uniref:hypothetical protein n=1 Tax=Lentzea aerocolonigenes TaxID=68170 RepID=UPI0006896219|nr:hypothetical protein [Lentzea aerocolonigenes]MCP2242752.1 hypothetical protein [Lentzea aerocolonigenes]
MTTNLVRELKTLRKGRGVHAGRIVDKVGAGLAAACGITRADGPAAARQKLVTRLTELVEQLPEDLQLAARAAFGLIPDVRHPLYQERVGWVAAMIDRDARTVRRRVDEAVDQLAELAVTTARRDDGGWHTAELSVAVALDQGQPEVLERYQVVVDSDGVDSLEFASVFPVRRRDVDVHLLYGGTLQDRGSPLERPGFTLVPAEPLARGATYDFAVRYRLLNRDAMHPCVLHVPERPCEVFDLRVRFEHDRKRFVRTFDGVLQRSDTEPSGNQHAVDRAGEIHVRFRRLLPGLLYGARWGGSAVCSARRAS